VHHLPWAQLQPLNHLHQVLLRHHLNHSSAQVAGSSSVVGLRVVKHGCICHPDALLGVLLQRQVWAVVTCCDSSGAGRLLLLLLLCWGGCCGIGH
jgi:hypothetical protein